MKLKDLNPDIHLDRRGFMILGGASTIATGVYAIVRNSIYPQHEQNPAQLPMQTLARPMALDFSLNGPDGNLHSLSEYREQTPVIVNFFHPSLEECMREIHEMEQFARLYAGKVSALAVTTSTDTAQYVSDNGLTSTLVLTDNGLTFSNYHVPSMPFTILVSREGRLHWYFRGPAGFMDAKGKFRQEIDKLVAESSTETNPAGKKLTRRQLAERIADYFPNPSA